MKTFYTILGFGLGVLLLIAGIAIAETPGGLTLPQGGLGITTVTPGLILVGSNTQRVTSTSSPTIGYFTATSTTASSTAANGINISAGCFAFGGTCVGGSGLTGSGSNGQVTFWTGASSLSGEDNLFWDATNNRLGVGTSTPTRQLHVVASGLVNANITADSYNSVGLGFHPFTVRAARGSVASPAVVQQNDTLFSIDGQGYIGTGFNSSAVILATAEDTYTSTNSPSAIRFQTTPVGSLTRAERVRIDPSGNLGVGTTSPGSLLSLGSLANFTTATSTFYSSGGINLIGGGCHAIDGTCVGGGGAATSEPFVTISNTAGLSAERALTGTTNQITVTDNGADSSVVLSTPQDIHTSASPTFTGMTLSGITQGSVLFAGVGGIISQDNSNFYWDNTNKRLGLGLAAPNGRLEVLESLTDPVANRFALRAIASTTITSNNAFIVNGIEGRASLLSANNLTSTNFGLRGLQGTAQLESSGTVTTGAGIFGAINNTGAGTITSSAAIRANAPTNSGGGALSNYASFWAAPISQGSVNVDLLLGTNTFPTSDYAIYSSNSDDSYINGNLGVGTTSPAQKLSVTGSGYFTGGLGVGLATTSAGYVDVNTGYAVKGTHAYLLGKVNVFTSAASSTYSVPTGVRALRATCVGGGGGGGGAASAAAQGGAGGGGGGGSQASVFIIGPAASYVYTVGTGGNGGSSGNNAGAVGNATILGTTMVLTCGGGFGGSGAPSSGTTAVVLGGAGGTASVGDWTGSGNPGSFGISFGSAGAASGNGGGNGYGGGALGVAASNNGNTGGNYGGGGSGGAGTGTGNSKAGGPGAAGLLIIEEYY